MSTARSQIWSSATSSSSPSAATPPPLPWLPASFTPTPPSPIQPVGMPQGNERHDKHNWPNDSFRWTCKLCNATLMDKSLAKMHIKSHSMRKNESFQNASDTRGIRPQKHTAPRQQESQTVSNNNRVHGLQIYQHSQLETGQQPQIKIEPSSDSDDSDDNIHDDRNQVDHVNHVHSVQEPSNQANPNPLATLTQNASYAFECCFCTAVLRNQKALACHIRTAHQKFCPFYCKWTNCNFLSLDEGSMKSHIQRKHSVAVEATEYFIGTRKAQEAPRQEWQCNVCGRKMNSGPGLQSHLVAHAKVGYRCKWSGCGHFFPHSSTAKLHVKGHIKDTAFADHDPRIFLDRTNPQPQSSNLNKPTKSNNLVSHPSYQTQVLDSSKRSSVPPQLPENNSKQCSTVQRFSFRPIKDVLAYFARKADKNAENKIDSWPAGLQRYKNIMLKHDRFPVPKRPIPNGARVDPVAIAMFERTYNSNENDNNQSEVNSGPTYVEQTNRAKRTTKRIIVKPEPNSEEEDDDLINEPSNNPIPVQSDFTCSFCAKPYNNSQNLNTHYRTVHPDYLPFYCKVADCKYASFRAYCTEQHIRREHPEVGDNVTQHVGKRAVMPDELLECSCYLCGRPMVGTYRLKRHMKSHANSGFRCTWKDCGHFYRNQDPNARHHVKIHFGNDSAGAHLEPMDILKPVQPNAYSGQAPGRVASSSNEPFELLRSTVYANSQFRPSSSTTSYNHTPHSTYVVEPVRKATKRALEEERQQGDAPPNQTAAKRPKELLLSSPIQLGTSVARAQTVPSSTSTTISASTTSSCPIATATINQLPQPNQLVKRTDIITTVKNGSMSIHPIQEQIQVLTPSIRTNFSTSTVASFLKNNNKQPLQQTKIIKPTNNSAIKYNNSCNDLYAYKKPTVPNAPSKPSQAANVAVIGKSGYVFMPPEGAAPFLLKPLDDDVSKSIVDAIVNNIRQRQNNNKNILINVSTGSTDNSTTPLQSSAKPVESNRDGPPATLSELDESEIGEQTKATEPTEPTKPIEQSDSEVTIEPSGHTELVEPSEPAAEQIDQSEETIDPIEPFEKEKPIDLTEETIEHWETEEPVEQSEPTVEERTEKVQNTKRRVTRSTRADLTNLQASPSLNSTSTVSSDRQHSELKAKTTEQQQSQPQQHDSHCFDCHKKVTESEECQHCSHCTLTYHSTCVVRANLFTKQALAIERYNALEQKPEEEDDDGRSEIAKLRTLTEPMCDECVFKIVGKRFNRSRDGFDRTVGSYNQDVETTFYNIACLLINKVESWKLWGYKKLIELGRPTNGQSEQDGEIMDLKTIKSKAKYYQSIDEIMFDLKMVIHQRHISSKNNKHVIHNCNLLLAQALEEVRHIYLCDSCYRMYYKENHKNLPKSYNNGDTTYGGVFLLGCQNPHTVVWANIDEKWWPAKVFPNYTECSWEIATDQLQVITFGPQTSYIVEPATLYEYSSKVPDNGQLESEAQQIAVVEAEYYLTKQDSAFIDYSIPKSPRRYERGNLYLNTKPGQLQVAAQNDASGKELEWMCHVCREPADRRLDSCTASFCSEKCKKGFLKRPSKKK